MTGCLGQSTFHPKILKSTASKKHQVQKPLAGEKITGLSSQGHQQNCQVNDCERMRQSWIYLRSLEKGRKYYPKWWFDGDESHGTK